jgi:hypothetical protein
VIAMDKTFMSIIVLATAFYFINKADNSCAKQTGQLHVLMTGLRINTPP